MTPEPTLLIVEDEAPIRRFLRATLPNEGYRLIEADSGEQGLRLAANQPPDLVILDLGLPDIDGLEVIRRLREWSAIPIIVLSARDQEKEKIAALDAGADDYLTKPFGIGELLARLRVATRHASKFQSDLKEPVFSTPDFSIDFAARRVLVRDQEVHLTPLEYKLLMTLANHAGKVLTHRFLLKEVWGPGDVHETHYLRVFMTSLRRKIESDPARPKYLQTEQGVGYRLAVD